MLRDPWASFLNWFQYFLANVLRSKGQGKETVQGRGLQRTRPLMNANQAAIKLQSVWRSYKARRTIQELRLAEFVFLGMVSTGHQVPQRGKSSRRGGPFEAFPQLVSQRPNQRLNLSSPNSEGRREACSELHFRQRWHLKRFP